MKITKGTLDTSSCHLKFWIISPYEASPPSGTHLVSHNALCGDAPVLVFPLRKIRAAVKSTTFRKQARFVFRSSEGTCTTPS